MIKTTHRKQAEDFRRLPKKSKPVDPEVLYSNPQISTFARCFENAYHSCWHVYVDSVRAALIDSFVLEIVLAQGEFGITDTVIRMVRVRLCLALASRYHMLNPIASDYDQSNK